MADVEEAFFSAMALFGENRILEVKVKDYAGLKASARMSGGKIVIYVARGFTHAERDVLFGLAISLLGSLFRRKYNESLTKSYRQFITSESASNIHGLLQEAHGRKRENIVKGRHYDLNVLLGKVAAEYYAIFEGIDFPAISWSEEKSKRRLGYYEDAFNRIVISRAFDDPRVPQFAPEYVIYHEMLHLKHKVQFQRGRTMRRTVHPRAFKLDEENFKEYAQAKQWISRNLWRID